jgi:hypothetical protein
MCGPAEVPGEEPDRAAGFEPGQFFVRVVRRASPLHEGLVRPQRTIKGKERTTPFHFQCIAHRGTCGKTRMVRQNR